PSSCTTCRRARRTGAVQRVASKLRSLFGLVAALAIPGYLSPPLDFGFSLPVAVTCAKMDDRSSETFPRADPHPFPRHGRMNTTSASLLNRLRPPGEEDAWTRFVKLYTPLLYTWAHRLNLQDQDAADLVQDVFATLVQKLPEFRYDRQNSF